MATIVGTSNTSSNDGNTLLLYHHEQSFYSQKVVFALMEKHLPFKSHIIQLPKFEQYEPWFIRLNPKGEVPVLRDGVKAIHRDCFQKRAAMRLLKIDEIPIEDLTIGCLLHQEFTHDTKLPKFIRHRMKALRTRRFSIIQEMMVQYPDLREHYERKLTIIQDKRRKQENRDELLKIMNKITQILDDVETELISHSTEEIEMWLTGERFTAADICLSVMLHRLFVLGLAFRWWGEDRRPHLAKYFEKTRRLESYKRACLTVSNYDKLMYAVEMLKQNMPYLVGTVVLVTALAFGVVFYKKLRK
uniref:GST N-terminal domain-containing protein n=1 Tax=Strigamia maritima TaxID=126957 RepID=T1J4A2_STRMM